MTDLPADLRACVEDQAQARLQMDVQGYAKYLTPEAVDTLRGSFNGIPPRVNRYEIDAVEAVGEDYWVNVRYFLRDDSFVVRSRWHSSGDGWKVIHAARIWREGEAKPGVFSRLLARILRPLARRSR